MSWPCSETLKSAGVIRIGISWPDSIYEIKAKTELVVIVRSWVQKGVKSSVQLLSNDAPLALVGSFFSIVTNKRVVQVPFGLVST